MAKRYDTYKGLRLPCFKGTSKIPSHWSIVPMRYLFHNMDYLRKPIAANERPQSNPIYDYYGASGVIDKIDFYNVEDTVLLIGEDGANLRMRNLPLIYKAKGRFWVNNHAHILKPIKDSYDYMFYLLESMDYYDYITGAAQPKLSQESLNKIRTILPPLSEQHSIVSYLDDKCAKIDKMLEGKQKQIELLAEMKQRIIADAVTRGLDPKVGLKESGIFWIKQIPSHWNVRRLGHVLHKENRERPYNAELLICTNKAKVIKRGDSKMGLVAESEDVYQGVKQGDLLIHGMDTWHGAIAVSEYDGMCTPVVHVCTSNENVRFISLYLRYMAMMKVFKLISNGVRQNTSDFRSWAKVSVIPCPLPPLTEQRAIVSYITEKTTKIDTLTAKLQQEIESIKEYKQRLISDVVTGQIKVC